MTALSFQTTTFDIVDHNNQVWLRVNQIGLALGYKNPDLSVSKLYRSNATEFTDTMTALVELDTEGGKQQVRIFSLRGCHLLGMLSKTKIAKEFRVWVLDILDHHKALEPAKLPPADDLPPDVLNAINSRAMALCLRHYEYNKIQLREAIKKWGSDLEGKKLIEFIQTIEQKDTRLVIVHRDELWKLTNSLASLDVARKKAMDSIHAIEASTGMEWYGRPDND